MLGLFPAEADGVFFLDMKRAMEAEFMQKAIAEGEDLQELIEKTGIDPTQDIFYLAGAMVQKTEGEEKERGAIVVNMKYDKDTLMPLIREKVEEQGEELTESEYEGYTLYTTWAEGKEGSFSFIDESNIVLGNPDQVQSVIDVIQKKKDNVFKNPALADLISKTDKQALLWGAIHFKPETLEMVTAEAPMLQDLQGIQSASLTFDFKNQNYTAQIKLMGGDEEKNKQIAELLGKDPRSVWDAYEKAKSRMKVEFKINKSVIAVPISVLKVDSVLGGVVVYLKKQGWTKKKIASVLKRTEGTISNLYKRGAKNE